MGSSERPLGRRTMRQLQSQLKKNHNIILNEQEMTQHFNAGRVTPANIAEYVREHLVPKSDAQIKMEEYSRVKEERWKQMDKSPVFQLLTKLFK